ncbi:MAG TPA: glycerophosphodiester phosphodiesterase [Longimicrobiales bacterium]|nr:glycerophosphodiester phosphodiesterase [Longimicrobiales bacterium]
MSRRPTPSALAGAPLLVAHRCGAGLAPENTLLAMLRSRDDWAADMIELDVHVSADGHVVVIHDPTVDRTTDGSGAVAAMTLDQLRAFDAGYRFTTDGGQTFPFRGQGLRIPTLDEVLDALPDMRFTVEVKAVAAQGPMFELVRRRGAQDRIVAAGIHDVVRTRFSEWKGAVSASMEQARAFYLRHRLHLGRRRAPAVDAFQVPETWGRLHIVTPRFIRDAHELGIAVQVWTVNDAADMERLFRWGVDGIQSDFPDRLSAVMTRLFGRPPAPALVRSSATPGAATPLE